MTPQKYLRQQTPEMRRIPWIHELNESHWPAVVAIIIGIIVGAMICH